VLSPCPCTKSVHSLCSHTKHDLQNSQDVPLYNPQPVAPYCLCVSYDACNKLHMLPWTTHPVLFCIRMNSYVHDKTWYSLLFKLIYGFKSSVVTSRLLTAEARLHFRPVIKIRISGEWRGTGTGFNRRTSVGRYQSASAVIMEAILLCSALNKLQLFCLTQRGFIVIQMVTFTCVLHVSACTWTILKYAKKTNLQTL
jgi:hypothetical protein